MWVLLYKTIELCKRELNYKIGIVKVAYSEWAL